MRYLKTIISTIALAVVGMASNAAHAACEGYNTGGKVDCYTAVDQIPVQGKAVTDFDSIESVVKAEMVRMGVVNTSIAIRYSDNAADAAAGRSRLVYNRAFGHAISDPRSRSGYGFFTQSEDAVANYASMTKAITVQLLLDGVQKGYVSLSDNVFCLPGNTAAKCWITGHTANVEPRYARITVQNVLDYKIGVPTTGIYSNTVAEGISYSAIQAILDRPLDSEPGTIYSYNSFGHQMLGVLLEIVMQQHAGTQRSFEELVHTYLTRPIGIRDADMFQIKDNRPQFRDPRTMWYDSNMYGLDSYGGGKVGGSADYQFKPQNYTAAGAWAGTTTALAKFASVYGCGIGSGALDGTSVICYNFRDSNSGVFTVIAIANKMWESIEAAKVGKSGMAVEPIGLAVAKAVYGIQMPSEDLDSVSASTVLAMEYKLIRPENGREAYFRTGSQAEIDGLAAALANDPNYLLKPTTNSFHAWPKGYTGYDVRRFIFDIKNQSGASIGASHWYGIDAAGNDGVNYTQLFHGLNPFRKPDQGLMFEAATFSAFPLKSDGTCPTPAGDTTGKVPPGLVPLYSVYNNAYALSQAGTIAFNDGNHRFTTNETVVDDMVAKGWVRDGKVYCVLH